MTTKFHLAGKYKRNHSSLDLDEIINSNFRFGTQLLEAMSKSNTDICLINAGSYFQNLDQNCGPAVNLYGAVKEAFTKVLDYYCDANGLKIISLIIYT